MIPVQLWQNKEQMQGVALKWPSEPMRCMQKLGNPHLVAVSPEE